MSKDWDDPNDPKPDYEVGYGKPPNEHKFKKGQSGNPKGHPKRLSPNEEEFNFYESVKEELNDTIQVREGNQLKETRKGDAMIKRILNDALKGKVSAQKLLMEFMKESGQLQPKEEQKKYAKKGLVIKLAPTEEDIKAAIEKKNRPPLPDQACKDKDE